MRRALHAFKQRLYVRPCQRSDRCLFDPPHNSHLTWLGRRHYRAAPPGVEGP